MITRTKHRKKFRRALVAIGASVGIAAVILGAGAPTFASASRAARNAPRPAWRQSSDIRGCPSTMHLLVPTRGTAYFAAHPRDLLLNRLASKGSAIQKVLQKAAAAHIRFITSLHCAHGHPGQPLPAKLTHQLASSNSRNWSGYEGSNAHFLGATMEWIVPAVVEPSNLTVVSSIWPGIGTGESTSDTLVQAGTEQDGACELGCTLHKTSYYFWEELFPQVSQEVITNMTADPGDDVAAIAEYDPSSNQALFELYDFTTASGVYDYQNITGNSAGSGSSAEWIVERTESCGTTGNCTWPSLNNFGTEGIINAQAASGPNWSQDTIDNANSATVGPGAINMTDCAGTELAQTNGFSSSTSFSVAWRAYGPSDPAPNC